jgi:hypothetical protein
MNESNQFFHVDWAGQRIPPAEAVFMGAGQSFCRVRIDATSAKK